MARYAGEDQCATKLYRSAYPARHWVNDLPSVVDSPAYGPTVLAHNRVSQICAALLLATPLPDDESDREAAKELADAGIDLLQTSDPDCSLTADPPQFPNFAANHAKHLGFFYEIVGKANLADLYRARAEVLFKRVAAPGSKGDLLREQFAAHACLVRRDFVSGAERLARIVRTPGIFAYVPKVAHECYCTLVRLASLDLISREMIPSPPWGDAVAPEHALAHKIFVAVSRQAALPPAGSD
ncbi:hypothetical protein HZA87_02840 [Candidatus Uhrbacteria bacterium]|nr:hypothetical protein [Candidatus Uhrbacteria bacterium]